MGLYQKLICVMAETGAVEKTGLHKQGYRYAKASNIFEQVRASLVSNGVCFVPVPLPESFTREPFGRTGTGTEEYIYRLWVLCKFIDPETGESESAPWPGDAIDTRDKGFQKAESAAIRSCLERTFLLHTEDPGEDPGEDPAAQAGDSGDHKPLGLPRRSDGQAPGRGGLGLPAARKAQEPAGQKAGSAATDGEAATTAPSTAGAAAAEGAPAALAPISFEDADAIQTEGRFKGLNVFEVMALAEKVLGHEVTSMATLSAAEGALVAAEVHRLPDPGADPAPDTPRVPQGAVKQLLRTGTDAGLSEQQILDEVARALNRSLPALADVTVHEFTAADRHLKDVRAEHIRQKRLTEPAAV